MPARLDPRLAGGLALALVVGGVVAILAFGRISLPAFPSLREQPDLSIAGTIAYLRYGEERGTCVLTVPASGAAPPKRLYCAPELAGPVSWQDGLVRIDEHRAPGSILVRVDPETGAVRDRRPSTGAPGPAGARAWSPEGVLAAEGRDGRACLYVDGERRRRIACVDGQRDYTWWSAQWSPDRRWAVVQDSAERLLLVRISDGAVRLLVDDGGEPAWGPAVEE
jgi:hypothetical protein